MKKTLDSVLGASNTLARVSDAFAAVPGGAAVSDYVCRLHSIGSSVDIPDGIGTVAGAGAGALYFKNHRVLGAIGGASIGRNVPALLNDAERRDALCNMSQTGAGILGARMLPGSPVVGFLLGWIGVGVGLHVTGLRK